MSTKNNIKPYLMVAFYTWAMDSDIVPILEVKKHPNNIVPDDLKKKEKILFSIHPNSVTHLIFGKNSVQFYAKFKGNSFHTTISNEAVSKIFNKDNGNGLEFGEAIEVNQIETENENIAPEKLAKKINKSKLILIKNE